MDIGAAYPAEMHIDDGRTGSRIGLGHVDQFESALPGDQSGLHDVLPVIGSLHQSRPRRSNSWYSAISHDPVSISGQIDLPAECLRGLCRGPFLEPSKSLLVVKGKP